MIDEVNELRAMAVPALVERYREVCGKEPRVKNKAWLWKRIAWKLQEQRFGGLSMAAKARLEELIAEIDLPIAPRRAVAAVPARKGPVVGTTLTREWRGQRIDVRVVDAGFEWNGVVYRSLSAVAQAVTGTHWNGNLFFGMKPRKATR